jgi:hypothetical protein
MMPDDYAMFNDDLHSDITKFCMEFSQYPRVLSNWHCCICSSQSFSVHPYLIITRTLSNEITLTTLHEYHEKDQWWLNELRSLGLEVNRRNEFNDIKEISNLANNLKKRYYVDYRNSSGCND